MKKIIMLLVALSIAAMFVACKTDEMDVNVKSLPKGAQNYDFEGTTFSYTNPNFAYILKETIVTSGTTNTVSQIFIPLMTRNLTVTFNEDGTFSLTDTQTFAAGMDATYTNDATTQYFYREDGSSPFPGTGSASGHSCTGFNGQQYFAKTYTGTWDTYEEKVSDADNKTLVYVLSLDQTVITQKTFSSLATGDYATNLTNTDITTTPYTDSKGELSYTFEGINESTETDDYYLSVSFPIAGAFGYETFTLQAK